MKLGLLDCGSAKPGSRRILVRRVRLEFREAAFEFSGRTLAMDVAY